MITRDGIIYTHNGTLRDDTAITTADILDLLALHRETGERYWHDESRGHRKYTYSFCGNNSNQNQELTNTGME